MSFTKIAIAAAALIAFATSASADFRYTGSPKLGQFYVQDSALSARAELLPQMKSSDPQTQISKSIARKGGIGSRGI